MKRWMRWSLVAALLFAVPVGDLAWAHGGRGGGHGRHGAHIGLFIGVPLLLHHWWHYSYPPPPQVVVVPREPEVYVDRGGGERGGYWYHCDRPEGYYPYIKECPGGWQREVPRAPPD